MMLNVKVIGTVAKNNEKNEILYNDIGTVKGNRTTQTQSKNAFNGTKVALEKERRDGDEA